MVQFTHQTIKEIWAGLRDIPVNDNLEIEEPFFNYPIGTECTEIWHDLEEHYNISVGEYQFRNDDKR